MKIKEKRDTEKIKFLVAILWTITCAICTKSIGLFISTMLCILFSWSITQVLKKYKIVSYILNSVLLLIIYLQLSVMLFARNFLTSMMLTNVSSVEDISGKFYIYIPLIVIIAVISFLPISSESYLKDKKIMSFFITVFLVIMIIAVGRITKKDPYLEFSKLIREMTEYNINDTNNISIEELEDLKQKFYKSEIKNFKNKPENISNKENIILIMTEGMSKYCIDYQNLMPNMKKFSQVSINFDNYYNHTFATYRGIIGQLYSGYQENNLDENRLISIQEILKNNGYKTIFINTEPQNVDFSNYITSLNFDEVYTETACLNGAQNSISDKDAYEILYNKAMQEGKAGQPFFIVIYTFGTHVNQDSPDIKYGDGSNSMLNRCSNVDEWFGEFFHNLKKSELYNNTMLVLTADHCSYRDIDFENAFPQYKRKVQELDAIPFSIYYKGVEPQMIDAGGRNTLDMAPTLLDLLDISSENYFLGQSLFSKEASSDLETTYQALSAYYSTANGEIMEQFGNPKKISYDVINDYFKLQEGLIGDLSNDSMHASFENNVITVKVKVSEYNNETQLAVWNEDEGKDTIKWYYSENNKDSSIYTIPLSDFDSKSGAFQLHLFSRNKDGTTEFITSQIKYIE